MRSLTLSCALVASLSACPDDEPTFEPPTLTLEAVTAYLVIEPSTPDAPPYDQRLDLRATCSGRDAIETELVVTAVAVHGKDAAGVAQRYELPGARVRSAEAVRVGPTATTQATGFLEGDAVTNARLGVLCGLGEPTLALGATGCGATTEVDVPLTLTCYPDRRPGELADLEDAGAPDDMPCGRRSTLTGDEDEAIDYRLGYDADGRHIYTDRLYDGELASRIAHRYDDDDRLIAIVEIDAADGLASFQAQYNRDASGRVRDALVEVTPLGGVESEWRARYVWSYPGGDDQGWSATRDGVPRTEASFDAARNELTEEEEGSTDTASGFEAPFERERWLVASDVERLHALRPTRLTTSDGVTLIERRLTWTQGRITSDVTTVNGLTFVATWDYDCEGP